MSHNRDVDAEHVNDDDDDKGDDLDEDHHFEDRDGSENDYANIKLKDTTTSQAKMGKDLQGISWRILGITRDKYRQTRLEHYKSYENIPQSGDVSNSESKVVEKGGMYYQFRRNSRSVESTFCHFQLRNLVWATSKHDVFLTYNFLKFSMLLGMLPL